MEQGQEHLLICSCESKEHQIIISFDKEDNLMYATIHLHKFGFWRRLIHGIHYIFGKKSTYGDFDDFIFRKQDADKLIDIGNKLKNNGN